VYRKKLPDPLSVVLVVGWPVPKGGGKPGEVVVDRLRSTEPKLPPFAKKLARSVDDGPVGSEQTEPLEAIDMVTQLLTIFPIWTATGT
jgi:hypothetical protein